MNGLATKDIDQSGWEVTTIGNVCKIITGKLDVNRSEENGKYPFFTCAEKVYAINEYAFDAEAVLLAGNGFFNVKYYKGKFNAYQRTYVLYDASIDTKYLYYYLKFCLDEITGKKRGSTIPYIRLGDIRDQEIPVAPLAQQKRIVAKIEELFSHIDAGIAALNQAKQLLKQYRQSVLKAAVTGELTKEWREQNKDKLERASKLLERILTERRQKWEAQQMEQFKAKGKVPKDDGWKVKYQEPDKLEEDFHVPQLWVCTTISQVAECLDSMRKPINKNERSTRIGEIPYYGANGPVGFIDDYIFDEPLVLVVEDETFVGRTIPFTYKISGKSWVNNHAHVLRASDAVLTDYLNYSLMFYPFTPLTTGSTGRRKLTQKALNKAPYVLPPIKEQEVIVDLIESRLNATNRLLSEIDSQLVKVEKNKQSILAAAFSGQLA